MSDYKTDRKRNYDIKLPVERQMDALWDLVIAIAENTNTPIPASTQEILDFYAKVKAKYPKSEK